MDHSFSFVDLKDRPELSTSAPEWFHEQWGHPAQAYAKLMNAYLRGDTPLGWYLCLEEDRIIGGLGIIDNDFHDRPDLAPNVCAVYTEPERRGLGIAGRLLDMAVEGARAQGISPIYLITDHTGFYERYGWEFYCMVNSLDGDETSRLYIHR